MLLKLRCGFFVGMKYNKCVIKRKTKQQGQKQQKDGICVVEPLFNVARCCLFSFFVVTTRASMLTKITTQNTLCTHQALLDGGKLLMKPQLWLLKSHITMCVGPILSFIFSLAAWCV